MLSKNEIEREIPLDIKLKLVVPEAHGITGPAGNRAWQDFVLLKRIRDRLIHLKSVDSKASGPEDQTVWGIMLEKKQLDFSKVAYELISAYNCLVQNRRWFNQAKRLFAADERPEHAS
jgi:hypothetical protein